MQCIFGIMRGHVVVSLSLTSHEQKEVISPTHDYFLSQHCSDETYSAGGIGAYVYTWYVSFAMHMRE